MISQWLFKHIDNSPLIVFRIFFGLLCFLESVGAIFTGWVKHTLIEPEFTFSFIGFEWLQPLPGNGMYIYYLIMGVFSLFIMLGYRYRIGIIAFTLMWSATYLMQKASYNNHYYLLILLSAIMVFQPANTYASLDVKRCPEIEQNSMPQWCKWVFVLQLLIVYTYASIAKIYPDWLDTTVIELLMKGKSNYILIGDLLQQKWVHYGLAYGGILFDGLIIPLLLYKPTRKYAFIAAIFFHLFNSIVFQVGIFPYLALAFTVFFFESELIQKLFLKKKSFYKQNEVITPRFGKPFVVLFSIYFLIQIVLPMRHHFIKDNVLWTEEGHRLSWRMMLRVKSGMTTYTVVDNATNKKTRINLDAYLTRKQKHIASSKPDVMWQFSQYLKKHYKAQGQDVSVYINSKLSVNGKALKPFINSKVDIANVPWQTFKHNDWILDSKQD